MKFPLILKPARKSPEWMQVTDNFKVLKVDTPEQLLETAPRLLEVVDELILQSWINGPDANMHSLYVCFDRNSEPLFEPVVAKKLRQWPPDIGVGSLSVRVEGKEIMETGMPLLKKLGFVGVGCFQFKQDEDDKRFYIMEMNTRSGLGCPVCEACGIEATFTHYCEAAGLPLPDARTVTRTDGKWICWKTDLASAYVHRKKGDLTVGDWLKTVRGHKWSADIRLDDPLPQIMELAFKIKSGLSPKSRKAFQSSKG